MCIRDSLWIIPAEIYKGIMKESAPVANYTNELMATRFSDVMWLIEQDVYKRQISYCFCNHFLTTINTKNFSSSHLCGIFAMPTVTTS